MIEEEKFEKLIEKATTYSRVALLSALPGLVGSVGYYIAGKLPGFAVDCITKSFNVQIAAIEAIGLSGGKLIIPAGGKILAVLA
jgi:hypothetical protein